MIDMVECSDFDVVCHDTKRGQELIAKAQKNGTFDDTAYEAYSHQETNFTCGYASLRIALNSIRPEGEWDEGELRQASIKAGIVDERNKSGINMGQLEQIVKLFGCDVKACHTSEASFEDFEDDLHDVFTPDRGKAIICNFSSRVIFPKCKYTGHFSPLGGTYKDRTLVLDVGQETKPFWLHKEELYLSMNTIDRGANKKRGWLVVW